jgi:hypothetical protein
MPKSQPFNVKTALDEFQEIMIQNQNISTFTGQMNFYNQLQKFITNIHNVGKIEGFAEGEKVGFDKGFLDGSTIKIEL